MLMRGRAGRVVLAAICAAVGAAWLAVAPAGAEPISELGSGRYPSAVTDAAGTLHAVWDNASPDAPATMYCRVPAGAASCQAVTLPPAPKPRRPFVFVRPSDGALFVVVTGKPLGEDFTTYLYGSANGGLTWSGPVAMATTLVDIASARLTADGTAIDLVGDETDGYPLQRISLTGGPSGTVALGAEATFDDNPELGLLPDGRLVLAADASSLRTGFRIAGGADALAVATWSPFSGARPVGGTHPRLATGPSGAWMLTAVRKSVRVWRWNGRAFARPRMLGGAAAQRLGGRDVFDTTAMAQDDAGGVHAAWQGGATGCGRRWECILYRRTAVRGFGPTFMYPIGRRSGDAPQGIVVAPNAGAAGWIVWTDYNGGPGGRVRSVPLSPLPPAARHASRRIARRLRVAIGARIGCVAPGARFTSRLVVEGRRAGVRIVRVRFFFDGGLLARRDGRAPYRATYRLGFPAAGRHVAAATVTYRSRGRTHRATVGRMIVMCPS